MHVGLDEKQRLRDLVEEMSDATMEELAEAYAARYNTALSRSSMSRALQRFGITRKKKHPRSRDASGPRS